MASADLSHVFDTIIDASGHRISPTVRLLLDKPEAALSESEKSKIDAENIRLAMWRGFFKLAAQGHTFTSIDRIRENFGATLEQNYPEASKTFLNVARSYWTYKLVMRDSMGGSASLLDQLVGEFEFDFASVFFPTPGPARIAPSIREQKQRELLARFAPEINAEDFIRGNPILIRDKSRASRAGCLGVLLVSATVTLLIVVMLIWATSA